MPSDDDSSDFKFRHVFFQVRRKRTFIACHSLHHSPKILQTNMLLTTPFVPGQLIPQPPEIPLRISSNIAPTPSTLCMPTIQMENSSPLYCIVPVCKVQLPEFISCSRTPTSKTSTTLLQTFILFVSCIFRLPPRLPNDSQKGHSTTLCYPRRESAQKSKKVTRIVFDFRIFGPCSLLRPCVLPCLLLP